MSISNSQRSARVDPWTFAAQKCFLRDLDKIYDIAKSPKILKTHLDFCNPIIFHKSLKIMLITYTLLIFTILIKVNRSAKEFPRKYFSNDKSILPNALAVTHQNSEIKFPKHFYVVINSTFFVVVSSLNLKLLLGQPKTEKGKSDQSHKKLSRQDKICWIWGAL